MSRDKFSLPLLIFVIYITISATIIGILLNNFLLVNEELETPSDYLKQFATLDSDKTEFIIREGLPLLKGRKEIKTNEKVTALLDKGIRILPYSVVIKEEVQTEEQGETKEEKDIEPRKKDLAEKEERLEEEGTHEGEEGTSINLWQTDPPDIPESPEDSEDDIDDIKEDDIKEESEEIFFDKDESVLGIYHAHTAEDYSNGDNDYRADIGEKGDVVELGKHLAETLKNGYNLLADHSKKIHDQIHSRSYIEALSTAEKMVERNNDLKMLFDIHRDSIPGASKEFTTTEIDGEEVAKIMLVVTNDQYDLPHPNWEQNLQFARQLGNKMEQMYPGLLREVKLIENRRYNQHLHTGAVLLEVGSTNNDLEEAKRAIELFADVIAEFLRQQDYQRFDYLD